MGERKWIYGLAGLLLLSGLSAGVSADGGCVGRLRVHDGEVRLNEVRDVREVVKCIRVTDALRASPGVSGYLHINGLGDLGLQSRAKITFTEFLFHPGDRNLSQLKVLLHFGGITYASDFFGPSGKAVFELPRFSSSIAVTDGAFSAKLKLAHACLRVNRGSIQVTTAGAAPLGLRAPSELCLATSRISSEMPD